MIDKVNLKRPRKQKMSKVTKNEWWTFIACILVAPVIGIGGEGLFETEAQRLKKSHRRFTQPPDITAILGMSKHQFTDLRKVFPMAFCDLEKADENVPDKFDPWWRVSTLIDNYNKNRNESVAASVLKTLDRLSAQEPLYLVVSPTFRSF